ncbi:MAG: outer membrane beta-barrel protein [Verrucomicrobiaceae bacterium]|nr:outer membrane beta-barrel protein [Verrucomicrobiaceae bacterium]
MKFKRVASAFALSLGLLSGAAHGQGLLSIGSNVDDFEQEDIPLTWTVSGYVGYDSNINSIDIAEESSVYLQAGIGTQWSGGSRTTRYTLGASASVLYYFDDVTVGDDENVFYSVRLQGSVVHRASRRLTLSDSFYATYEYEPNQQIGATVSRRTDQYFYLYNNAALSYAWTRRFSTVASWVTSGITYDGDDVEDRWANRIGLAARYLWTRATTLVGEYRFGITDYETGTADYTSHYLLAGVDHMFNRVTQGSVRVGAEFRDNDNYDSNTSPYIEASLVQLLNEGFSLRWAARYGLEDSELGSFESRTSIRMGVTAQYEFNPRLTGTAGMTYVHSELDDSYVAGVSDGDEDFFGINLGLSYLLYSNVRVEGGYSYGALDSNIDSGISRDFDRHRVFMGVSANF